MFIQEERINEQIPSHITPMLQTLHVAKYRKNPDDRMDRYFFHSTMHQTFEETLLLLEEESDETCFICLLFFFDRKKM